MLSSASITDDIKSLDIPDALIELLLENSLNREQILRLSVDDLACILTIDIETAKIIQSSVRKKSNNWMKQEMTELG